MPARSVDLQPTIRSSSSVTKVMAGEHSNSPLFSTRVCLSNSHVGEIRAVERLMEDKRLDLDAPLMSIRRHTVQSAAKDPLQVSALTFYKSELKSGPVRNPGVVPFFWEQKPGQPKGQDPPSHRLLQTPPLPPRRKPNDSEIAEIIRNNKSRQNPMPSRQPPAPATVSEELPLPEVDDDNFSDVVSGLSGIPNAVHPSGSFPNDSKVRDFMMLRFLPAAEAIATGSTQVASKKPPKVENTAENGNRRVARDDDSLLFEEGDQSNFNSDAFRSLLPPPLPKTPSESWLSRTLPSLSSKKQAFHASFPDPKQRNFLRHLESEKSQQCTLPLTQSSEEIRKHSIALQEKAPNITSSKPQVLFADVLTMPLSP